jgi:hypothetical protein
MPGPFLSLKPIKPIVDIQCMNNMVERYKMFLKTANNRLRKFYFVKIVPLPCSLSRPL